MSNLDTFSLLSGFFGEKQVIKEWDVGKNSEDALQRDVQYCPRIDFAVKPLNIDNQNILKNRDLIFETYEKYRNFFSNLSMWGITNYYWRLNPNPRCFLAIEYENKTTTKHRFGSLINACAIGCVGLVIAVNVKTYNSYSRIVKYMHFLDVNEKLQLHPKNYIILRKDDFEKLLL